MVFPFRHYGRSYIYDRLHWASVYILMGLSALGAVQFTAMVFTSSVNMAIVSPTAHGSADIFIHLRFFQFQVNKPELADAKEYDVEHDEPE